jgi:hypothetical protein
MTGVCRSAASPEPYVLRGRRVRAHEGVVQLVVAGENLTMDFALIIVPDTPALSWEDRADAQEKWHLAWLEDAALWVHERKALALELEASPDVLVAQNQISALQRAKAIKGRLPDGSVTREGVVVRHAIRC